MSSGRQSPIKQASLIAGKDLKIFFLDRGAFFFAAVFPFVFVVIFSAFMGGAWGTSDEVMVVHIATEEAEGSLSQSIIDAMVAAGEGLDVRQADPQLAREAMEAEQLAGYLLFPAGFSESVLSGAPARVIVYTNPETTTLRAALLSIGQSIVSEIQSYRVMFQAVAELTAGYWFGGAILEPGQGSGPGVGLVFEEVGKIEPPRPVDMLIPGYLTMFVFFALAMSAEAIAAEKENQTLERLVAGTASRLSILGGKLAGSFTRGVVQVAIFWAAGILIFHVRMGHYPWAAVLVSVLLTLAAAGIGVFLATVAKNRKAAGSIAVFVSLSFAALGGSWWPLFIMPQWLQNLAKITPHAWANMAFNKLMLFGATPANVLPEMAALGLFAAAFLGLAFWRFRVN
jgi:ABC-2 type transport system permease protein